jgi:ferredoxin-NADP reductase/ferredoxin
VAIIQFEGRKHAVASGQTVLAALEADGVALDSSCRAGICQSCLVRAVDGPIPRAAQAGLSPALAAGGYLLACVCLPEADISLARGDEARQRVPVSVAAIEPLSPSVMRLRLEPEAPFAYRAGQFIGLITPNAAPRSYSVASLPGRDTFIELHIRLIPGGHVSGLVANRLKPGDRLEIQGPSGGCFYDGIAPDQPLVLAGTGTGLAPLWGILQDALAVGHTGPIRLYHGALNRTGLYLVEALEDLARLHPNFTYHPVLRDAGPSGDLHAAVMQGDEPRAEAAYFLCGDSDLVGRLKKSLFLGGAKLGRIRSDPFLPTAAPARDAA